MTIYYRVLSAEALQHLFESICYLSSDPYCAIRCAFRSHHNHERSATDIAAVGYRFRALWDTQHDQLDVIILSQKIL